MPLLDHAVRLRRRQNAATRLLGQLGGLGPNLPDVAGAERGHMSVLSGMWAGCVPLQRDSWRWAQQPLKGALHGSCGDSTAMARRLV